jgi:nucleoid-associated protein YgaU
MQSPTASAHSHCSERALAAAAAAFAVASDRRDAAVSAASREPSEPVASGEPKELTVGVAVSEGLTLVHSA